MQGKYEGAVVTVAVKAKGKSPPLLDVVAIAGEEGQRSGTDEKKMVKAKRPT